MESLSKFQVEALAKLAHALAGVGARFDEPRIEGDEAPEVMLKLTEIPVRIYLRQDGARIEGGPRRELRELGHGVQGDHAQILAAVVADALEAVEWERRRGAGGS